MRLPIVEIKELYDNDNELVHHYATVYGGCNQLEVDAYTTGLVGGNASVHHFSITETMGGQWEIDTAKAGNGRLDLSLHFYGDSELMTMIKALRLIADGLEFGKISKGFNL